MIAVEEYLLSILKKVRPIEPQELPLAEALGAVLAEDLIAKVPVPPFTNSAMDGFAFRAADLGLNTSAPGGTTGTPAPGDDGAAPANPTPTLPVTGDIPAGDTTPHALTPGQAWRIMTGAPLPEGADTVVKVEDTDIPPGPQPLPEQVTIRKLPRAGANVRQAGEDAAAGDLILTAGEPLTPAAISSAVSVGYARVKVRRRPRVAVIATGDELVPAGEPLGHGQIPDSNGVLIQALAERADADVVSLATSGDSAADFSHALQVAAAADPDLIVTSGGVSAGAYDVVKEVGTAGNLEFVQVAMQPGKPQGFGTIRGAGGQEIYVATLPGNPVSVFVSFHMFVRPILAQLTGRDGRELGRTVAATAGTSWRSPAGKTQFVPVVLSEPGRPGETPVATPTHPLGSRSHFVASLHRADALAVIPADVTDVEQWSMIDVVRV